MTIFHLDSSDQLKTLPLSPLETDWNGDPVSSPPRFAFANDTTHFHFCAQRDAKSTVHPSALPGVFQAELWKYDVAEFFLRHPRTGTYLEINLSPNGAWWSCLFTAPLVRLTDREEPIPEVTSEANCTPEGWEARISIPLAYLQKTLNFGPDSRLHAAFLLDSPQRCLSSGSVPGGEPNFHHPELPAPISFDRY